MLISKVEIRNFRNFHNTFTIDLKEFSLILGENSSGKTNLLSAVAVIFSQDIFTVRTRRLEIDDFNYKEIDKYKQSVIDDGEVIFPEVTISVFMTGFNDAQQAAMGDWFVDKELTTAQITYRFYPSRTWANRSKWLVEQRKLIEPILSNDDLSDDEKRALAMNIIDLPINKYDYSIYGGGNPANTCDPYFLRMFKFEMLDALRDAKKELTASREFRLLYKILSHEGAEVDYTDIRSHLIELDRIVTDSKALRYIKANVDSLLAEISLNDPTTLNEVDFNFFKIEHTEILKSINLQYGDAPIAIERNGLGRNNLLYMSLILSHLYDNDSTGNTLFRAVAIEEPEAHLHPQLEDHLACNLEKQMHVRPKTLLDDDGNPVPNKKGEKINRDDLQIIATTHSSHVVAGSSLDNIVVIYKDTASHCVKSHWLLDGIDQTKAEGKRTVKYLRKYLDATKSTVFFARKIILVEGISEQTLLPVFYSLHKQRKPSADGSCVINVNGLAFKHFLRIVKNGYYVKCLVLTDEDGNERADKLKQDFEANNPQLIRIEQTTRKTFELDIIESNKSGDSKNTILAALKETAPKLYSDNKIETQYEEKDLDAQKLFELIIENRKADFAFNLSELIANGDTFTIPSYIVNGIDFMAAPEA